MTQVLPEERLQHNISHLLFLAQHITGHGLPDGGKCGVVWNGELTIDKCSSEDFMGLMLLLTA
ncbi:uncharacterized protein LOC144121140 isoform X2 [Amblyomma americanum]